MRKKQDRKLSAGTSRKETAKLKRCARQRAANRCADLEVQILYLDPEIKKLFCTIAVEVHLYLSQGKHLSVSVTLSRWKANKSVVNPPKSSVSEFQTVRHPRKVRAERTQVRP